MLPMVSGHSSGVGASRSPELVSSTTTGRDMSAAVDDVLDSHGFFVSAKEKAAEDVYLRRHPETAKSQMLWADVVKWWNSTSCARKKKMCREGIPPSMRRTVWPLLLESRRSALAEGVDYHALKLRQTAGPEVFATIERDLNRTFPKHQRFARAGGEGQTKLRNILCAYANMDPQVGYVQGMGFLAATLLLQIEDEEQCFWSFVSLMRNPRYSMAAMNAPGFPALHARFYQLGRLMRRKCASALRLLEKYQVDPPVYAMSWYLTLFVPNLKFHLVLRIWDMFLCEGWKIIHRVAIAFFLLHAKAFKGVKNDVDLVLVLRNMLDDQDADKILQKALKVKFKTADLIRWEAKYRSCM